MRVQLEPTTPTELADTPPEALLEKLEDAFIELGQQLLGTALAKGGTEYGEVAALEELFTELQRNYEVRLRELRKAILAEAKEQ